MAEMFDDITSSNIVGYWQTLTEQEAPYLGEVLFPNAQIPTDTIEWYRGKNRAPKPLAPSAFDAQAIPRDRQGYTKQSTQTRLFKESKYVDEQTRQGLARAQNSPIQAERDMILNHVYKDATELLRGAALTREIMRMQLLQTGKIDVSGNGQHIVEDYRMEASHIANAKTSWTDDASDPFYDIEAARDLIASEQGITLSRVILSEKTFRVMVANSKIKATILANNGNTAAAAIPKSVILAYLQDEFGLTFQVYSKKYTDTDGSLNPFVGDGNIVFMPDNTLGTTSFSQTPEELDLVANPGTDVTLTDTGVAVTTYMRSEDPVTKVTKVSQQVMPTFEMIDGVYVLHSFSQAAGGNTVVTGGVPTDDDQGGSSAAAGSSDSAAYSGEQSAASDASSEGTGSESSAASSAAASDGGDSAADGETTPPEA